MVDGEFVNELVEQSRRIRPLAFSAELFEVYDVPEGHKIEVKNLEEFLDRPRRKRGRAVLRTTASFIAYVQRHEEPGTTIYVDHERQLITAILNGHEPYAGVVDDGDPAVTTEGLPGWSDHVAVWEPRWSPGWQAWTTLNNWKSQEEFVEFLDSRMGDIQEPDGATLLEAISNLRIHSDVLYERAIFASDDRIQLTYREDDRPGTTQIPAKLTLRLAPWHGADEVVLTARLRFTRPTPAKPTVLFKWDLGDEPRRVIDVAMAAMASEIADGTRSLLLRGVFTPA